jgi:hypothetical protein
MVINSKTAVNIGAKTETNLNLTEKGDKLVTKQCQSDNMKIVTAGTAKDNIL